MSSTSDTSAIDEKKGGDTGDNDNLGKDIGKFLLSLVILVLILLFNFSIGGCVLYGCKIAQSNILPTDENCMPYSGQDPTITPIKINIFSTTIGDKSLSEKISFPYNKNNKNTILDILRNYKEKPNSNFLVNYFVSIMESLFVFNFSALNMFLNLLNNVPESIILIFGSAIIFFYIFSILFIDFFYLIYLWFYQMSWFFTVNTNSGDSGKPKWESTVNPIKLGIGCMLVILFFIIFLVGLMIIPFIPFMPLITMIICVFSIIGCNGEMNGKDTSILSIILDAFKYHKIAISTVITIFIILCAFANLGGLLGLCSVFTVVLIYLGTISIDIFTPVNQEKLSPLVGYDQAKRVCHAKKEFEMVGFVKSLFKGGSNITREIKKINKKYKK
jgi:hypothetical protein